MTRERRARKSRVDSKDSAVRAMAQARRIIVPPDDMTFTNAQTVIFGEIIDEFAKVDWTPHTIRLAALLARAVEQAQTLQEELIDEGYTASSQRGTPCLNPKVSAMNSVQGSVLSIRRTLALHALSGAKPSDVGKRRNINKGNEDDSPLNDDEDNLIATP